MTSRKRKQLITGKGQVIFEHERTGEGAISVSIPDMIDMLVEVTGKAFLMPPTARELAYTILAVLDRLDYEVWGVSQQPGWTEMETKIRAKYGLLPNETDLERDHREVPH